MRVLSAFVAAALVAALGQPARAADGSDTSGAAKEPLNDKEKADEAANAIGGMRDVLGAVAKLVEDARSERDALRLNCVNERKTQIAGLVKVAEIALEELKGALKDRQTEAVDHEYNKVTIARGKVDGYKTEAEQCIGMLAYYTGDVERTFSDDNKDSGTVDPTSPVPPETQSIRPPPASPLR